MGYDLRAVAVPLTTTVLNETYLYMLSKAASNFLSDGIITPHEPNLLDNYITTCGIQINNLPASYQNSDTIKIAQAKILSDIKNGIMPPQPMQLPILLTKGECLIWTYDNVVLYQEKIRREYIGGNHGISMRICKGMYYRTGQFRGHPVEHSYMDNMGIGSLYLTNKNLIFSSPTKAVKIPYSKLIGLTPYSDGIEVLKDGATKRMAIQGFDSWFVMNLLSAI